MGRLLSADRSLDTELRLPPPLALGTRQPNTRPSLATAMNKGHLPAIIEF